MPFEGSYARSALRVAKVETKKPYANDNSMEHIPLQGTMAYRVQSASSSIHMISQVLFLPNYGPLWISSQHN